jgi:hypothetical protein
MFLSAYHFAGDPDALCAAYDRFTASFAGVELDLHACVRHGAGITVYDACPTREIAEAFSTSPEFDRARRAAGLPEPRIDRLGLVHAAIAGGRPVAVRA